MGVRYIRRNQWPWSLLRRVPLVMIVVANGKRNCVRVCARNWKTGSDVVNSLNSGIIVSGVYAPGLAKHAKQGPAKRQPGESGQRGSVNNQGLMRDRRRGCRRTGQNRDAASPRSRFRANFLLVDHTSTIRAAFWCGSLFKGMAVTPRTLSADNIRLANPSGTVSRRLLCSRAFQPQSKTGEMPRPTTTTDQSRNFFRDCESHRLLEPALHRAA